LDIRAKNIKNMSGVAGDTHTSALSISFKFVLRISISLSLSTSAFVKRRKLLFDPLLSIENSSIGYRYTLFSRFSNSVLYPEIKAVIFIIEEVFERLLNNSLPLTIFQLTFIRIE
jgi:hypothetical protein